MQKVPKIFFLLAGLIFLSLIFLIETTVPSLRQNLIARSQSSLTLSAKENKFHVTFDIKKGDEKKFSQFLENLNLPQKTKDGLEFRLDSTSSAHLAFSSPAKATLRFGGKDVQFSGQTSSPFAPQTSLDSLKIPQDFALVLAGSNFGDFVHKRFDLPPTLKTYLEKNFNSPPQYLIITNQGDFIIAQKKTVDFTALKVLEPVPSIIPEYKEEQEENTTLYLVKVPQNNRKDLTAAFFAIGEWSFLASSREVAQEMIMIQKSQKAFFELRPKDATFVLVFANPQEPSDSFYEITKLDKKVSSRLAKVARFEFFLKQRTFSGLISFK